MLDLDKYLGCFLGLASGDAYCAPYEGGIIERRLWKFIGKTKDGKMRYTDDTTMSIDLAESIIDNNGVDPDAIAKAFADSYSWTRGYGPATAWMLKRVKKGQNFRDLNKAKFKDGSFGNGAGMRAPVLAMFYPFDAEFLKDSIAASSNVTHSHPLAVKGAELIAFTIDYALKERVVDEIYSDLKDLCVDSPFMEKIVFTFELILLNKIPDKKTIKNRLGNGMSALDSCVTAIFFGISHKDKTFKSMLDSINKLGGDTDTIGAMAGAIWGAFNGLDKMDKEIYSSVEDFLRIKELTTKIHKIAVEGY